MLEELTLIKGSRDVRVMEAAPSPPASTQCGMSEHRVYSSLQDRKSVVWPSLWPSRPNGEVHFTLESAREGTLLRSG